MQNTFSALRITDYEASKEFYLQKLGFQIDWEHRFGSAFPVFLQMTKEGLSLYLSEHKGDCQVGGLAYFYVSDVDAWFEDCQRHGVVPILPPTNQPWGNREMRLSDPDGNHLCISQRLSP